MILVDDAAIDGSAAIADRLAEAHPWVVALHLSRNFGQHAATTAGILHSSGAWVATVDEDLQHPPSRILELLERAVGERRDLVYAKPLGGVHASVFRDASSRGFKALMRRLTGNANLSDFNSFRLVRGSIGRAAASVSTHDTYLDICLSWFTQRVTTVEMDLRDDRYIQNGKSGYSLKSLLSHAWRMFFSSQIQILRTGAVAGVTILSMSLLGILYFLIVKLFFPEQITADGWTSLFLAICFFGGLSALMLGITLQYLSTLVLQAHGKPAFFVVDRSADNEIADWFGRGRQ
jgi:glycosyltransferase involved in cell wall biosynthesis